MQGCETLAPAESYSAHHPIQQPYNHYHGRRVDFCEGGEVLVYVWFIWEDCKCEYCAFAGKAPLMLPNNDKAPVLPSSLPNESALVTG